MLEFGTSNREHKCFETREVLDGSSCPYIFQEQGYWKIKVYDKERDFYVWVVAHRRLVEIHLSQKYGIPVKLHRSVEIHHASGRRADLDLHHLHIVGRMEHDLHHQEYKRLRGNRMFHPSVKYNKSIGIPVL